MFRVISSYRDGGTRPVVERGPWHPNQEMAQYWADILHGLGYITSIESQFRSAPNAENDELANALAAMA